jgi:hypothetical protein
LAATLLKTLGFVLFGAGVALYAVAGGIGGGSDDNSSGLLAVLLMVGGLALYFRSRKHAARSRAARVLGDSKPDVVYLRAFRADTATSIQALMQGLTTDEEQLAEVLRPFGDLVAIGRPGESLPPPGAAREYASDDQWKDTVTARVQSAPLVVLRAGVGAGLMWEVEHVFRNVDASRLIIWIFDLRTDDYRAFRDDVRARLGLVLPEIARFGLGHALLNWRNNPTKVRPGFICFSQTWQASFLPLPAVIIQLGWNDQRKAFSLALRPVFEAHRVPWRAIRRFDRM